MNNKLSCSPTLLLLMLCLGACNDQTIEPANDTSGSRETITSISTDAWLGKWNGPEGTFLEITGGEGKYTIIIQNLDGPKTYQGNSSGEEIAFERDGIAETIHATNGSETGMKWLADKSDCLTVRTGEGYCRD